MTIIVQGGRRQSLIAQGGRGVTASPGKKGPGAQPGKGGSGGSGNVAFRFAQGSYSGTGSAQSINIGFRPDVVWLKGGGNNACFTFSVMAADYSKEIFGASVQSFAGGITSLDSNGFSVGTDARANAAATTYYYQAWKVGRGTLALVSYAGNGADNRTISVPDLAGNTPDLVWVAADALEPPFYCTNLHSAGDSQTWENGNLTDRIQALSAGGFQVGANTAVNQNGTTYYAACWKKITGKFNIITYNGTGGDNRSITGAGLQPEFAVVQRRDATGGITQFRNASLGGDSTLQTTGGANTNRIQALEADGVQLGTQASVNTGTGTPPYTLLVFKA